ncbi:MAG: hypothetical protein Q9M36_05340 [Sulfurovum sp.]|nr:hypothetical protein [Sulfurovum sp.]
MVVEKKITQEDLEIITDDEDELIEDYLEEENEVKPKIPFQEVKLLDDDIEAIEKEIGELETFIELAKSIEIDTKAKSLLSALTKGFEAQGNLGVIDQKAIIFTESRRTQQFLFDYLSANGFLDKVVLFNGTNTDPKSKEIYKAWADMYKDSDRATGAKSADMKQAIVDYFKDTASIMIATEAGSEGIAKQRELRLTKLIFDLTHNKYKISVLDDYKGKRGFLKATKVSIQSYDLEEYVIITALTSDYKTA